MLKKFQPIKMIFFFLSKLETFRKVDFSHFFLFFLIFHIFLSPWFYQFANWFWSHSVFLSVFSCFCYSFQYFSVFSSSFFYFSNKNAPIFQSRPIIAFKSEFVAFVKPLCCCLQLHQTFMSWQRNLKGKKITSTHNVFDCHQLQTTFKWMQKKNGCNSAVIGSEQID